MGRTRAHTGRALIPRWHAVTKCRIRRGMQGAAKTTTPAELFQPERASVYMPQVCRLRRFRFRLQRHEAGRSRSSLAGIASMRIVCINTGWRNAALELTAQGLNSVAAKMPQDPHAEMGTPFSHDVHSSTRHSCQSRWISVIAQKSTRCKPRTVGLKRNASLVSSTIVRRSADVGVGVRGRGARRQEASPEAAIL